MTEPQIKRILYFVEEGKGITDIAAIYEVHRNSITYWMNRFKEDWKNPKSWVRKKYPQGIPKVKLGRPFSVRY